jgi:phage tail sheath gpL-like
MSISTSIRKPGPYTEIDANGANNSLPSTRQEIVIIAQRLTSGSVAQNIPIPVVGPNQAATYFGAGSIAHRMAIALFKAYPYASLTICGLDDSGTGVAATATITIANAATSSGVLDAYIGNDRVSIAISSGDAAAAIATKLSAEINKYVNLPVTATVNAAVVTLTAKNKGTCGNVIGRFNPTSSKYEPEIIITAGAVTASVVGFASGANDPAMDTAFAALASSRYHLYVIPFATLAAAQALDTHLEFVSNEINQRGARGYMFISAAVADATTISAVNAKRICLGMVRKCRRPAFENAAAFAGIQAAQETPWRAVNNAELVGCDAPGIADRFTFTEINNLLWSGVTPFEVGVGEKVRCVRAISTYTANSGGSPDPTWLDSFKIATADYVRDAIVESHKNNFANSVLRDNHVDGEPEYVVTPADINSNNIAVCKRIERAGGLNDVDAYKNLFTAVRNPDVAGRVDSAVPIDIVDAAHIFANTIKIVSAI